METLKDILWPIVVAGGLGHFIDFLIGKAGQQRAKDFLTDWWVRFDDVRWKNFGREEGLFAGQLIERWFGKKILSWRRILSAIILFNLFSLMGYMRGLSFSPIKGTACIDIACQFIDTTVVILIAMMFYFPFFLGFSLSVSFTILITFIMARFCGSSGMRNVIIFLLMLIINYFSLVIWSPISDVLKFFALSWIEPNYNVIKIQLMLVIHTFEEAIKGLTSPGIHMYKNKIYVDNPFLFASRLLGLLIPVFRFSLSIIFVGSFVIRPFVMRPVSLVWARIVESEKPVFTVIFGGAAAFATAISEAAKHL
jgi:hypothetical protein